LDRGHFVRGAEDGAFGAVAVVAADIDDECVVELALVFNFLNDPTDFMVGIGRVGRKNVRLTNKKLLLVGAECLPFLKLRSTVFGLAIRPRCELGIRRNYTEPLLVGEDCLAQLGAVIVAGTVYVEGQRISRQKFSSDRGDKPPLRAQPYSGQR
jgi:hypothetical protein